MGAFFRYAAKVPIHHKLYKELVKSMLIGSCVAYPYAYYHYLNYIEVVDRCYDLVRAKFDKNPEMMAKAE